MKPSCNDAKRVSNFSLIGDSSINVHERSLELFSCRFVNISTVGNCLKLKNIHHRTFFLNKKTFLPMFDSGTLYNVKCNNVKKMSWFPKISRQSANVRITGNDEHKESIKLFDILLYSFLETQQM